MRSAGRLYTVTWEKAIKEEQQFAQAITLYSCLVTEFQLNIISFPECQLSPLHDLAVPEQHQQDDKDSDST